MHGHQGEQEEEEVRRTKRRIGGRRGGVGEDGKAVGRRHEDIRRAVRRVWTAMCGRQYRPRRIFDVPQKGVV